MKAPLSRKDAEIVAAAVAKVIDAKVRGESRLNLDTPVEFSAGDDAFRIAVVKALELTGHLQRVYTQ